MKKIILFLIVAGFLFQGCRKEYECSQPVHYIIPISIVFEGYAANELTEIIVNRYKGETGFSELIGRDTIRNTHIVFNDRVAIAVDSLNRDTGFWNLEDQVDYQVVVVSDQRHYAISGTRKGPVERTWKQEIPCDVKAGAYTTMENTHVNDVLVYPTPGNKLDDSFYNYYIVLKKQ